MTKYKIMSARKFLAELPSLIKNGYKGELYTICISERFLKKIRKEMRMGVGESLTNIYIFCCGFVLDPNEQKNAGLYLRDCGSHYEIIMCRLHNSFFSSEDLLAIAISADSNLADKKQAKDQDALLDTFVGKSLKNDDSQTVFQNLAGYNMHLYFL